MEVSGKLIDRVVESDVERAVAERRQRLGLCLRLPEPDEGQECEGHELRIRASITILFAGAKERQLLEIGFLVEVGIRPKVKRKLAVEVAGAAGRSDDFLVQVRHTRWQSATVINITPAYRKEVRFLSCPPKQRTARIRVPALNDLSEVGYTDHSLIIRFRVFWYG